MSIGDFNAGAVVDLKFTSVSSGVATALSSGAVVVWKNNSTASSTAGVSLTSTFGSVTGLNHVRINTTADSTFYANGSKFQISLSQGTVGGASVAGYVVDHFSLRYGTLDDIADGTTGIESDLDALTSASSRLEATSTAIAATTTAIAATSTAILAGTTALSTKITDLQTTTTAIAATSTAIAATSTAILAGTTALSTKLDDLQTTTTAIAATSTAIAATTTAISAAVTNIATSTTNIEDAATSSGVVIADAAIKNTTFDTGAIDAAALATDAVQEIRDSVWGKTIAELSTAMPATPTVLQIVAFQHMAAWNLRITTASSGYDLIYNDAGTRIFAAAVSNPTTDSFQRAQWTT